MLAQGWEIIPLHASLEPLTTDEAELKTLAALRHLSCATSSLETTPSSLGGELYVVPVGEVLTEFTLPKMHRDYFVHMKRLFNRLASMLAEQVGATSIITGENIGQVSSQTLGNLGAVEVASDYPIMRPLLALDKLDIMHMAKALGTYEISTGPEQCDVIGPKHPTTVADLERLLENEASLGGIEELAIGCFENMRKVQL
jgi:thiamine biosynthesis protein ThiI